MKSSYNKLSTFLGVLFLFLIIAKNNNAQSTNFHKVEMGIPISKSLISERASITDLTNKWTLSKSLIYDYGYQISSNSHILIGGHFFSNRSKVKFTQTTGDRVARRWHTEHNSFIGLNIGYQYEFDRLSISTRAFINRSISHNSDGGIDLIIEEGQTVIITESGTPLFRPSTFAFQELNVGYKILGEKLFIGLKFYHSLKKIEYFGNYHILGFGPYLGYKVF